MALTVLDAGVVIAILDARDVHHEAAVAAVTSAIERGDDLVLPASACAEVLVAPYRRGSVAVETVDAFVDALPATVEPATRIVAARAAELRARHGSRLRLPDALVVATAMALGADRVITTDGRWPRLPVRVEVLQPGAG
ncbi:MAG: PIN domain-containing protein [Chloroflexi bacterium]|nr:PIN domain-containing protein [Chloroflexota bacterium]